MSICNDICNNNNLNHQHLNLGNNNKNKNNQQLNFVEKFLLIFLLISFIFPLTLPNNYKFGYEEIQPPELICSHRKLNSDHINGDNDESKLEFLNEVNYGGKYENNHCDSPLKQRVAIIVPYRNRSEHLKIFLKHMHNFLIKQNQIDYQIFIIEQDDNLAFNRANLLNIGFKESLLIDPNLDCFIFHDVDILPLNLEQTYICTELPKHLCSYLDKFRYVLIYPNLFGGVITINANQFKQVNGYSNMYSGWGGEDDDFYQRIRNRFDHIERYPSNIARCIMIKHGKYEANNKRNELLHSVLERSQYDGLSNLNQTYQRKKIEYYPLYVKIKVTLN